jgi:hypothetical protein
VCSYKFPISSPAEWTNVVVHQGAVSRMRLSPDNAFLFTGGEDGSLYIHRVTDKEGRTNTAPAIEWAD